MSFGPIEMLMIRFPGDQISGDLVPAMTELVNDGLVRIVDLLFIRKDAEGSVAVFELGDLSPDLAGQYAPLLTDVTELLNEDDAHELAASLENNSSAGIMLFYVQHQFEDTFWSDGADWSMHEAALHGSSHYDLPRPLRWLTANIGIHHVHHLASRIPFYRLTQVLRDQPELRDIGRLTLLESFRCVRLVLWDESRRRLVSFRQLRQLRSCEL